MAADGYWRFSEAHQAAAMAPPSAPLKRPRPDFESGPEMLGYYPREEGRVGHPAIRDTESVTASYDRYLRNGMFPGESVRPLSGVTSRPVDDPRMMGVGHMDPRNVGFPGGRPEPSLPQDASNTLFVEFLPANCTRREVAHIFRPFVGFQEVRLVNKESRHPGTETIVLCFVDFTSPVHAAFALDALQGYKFDENDRESPTLRLQFARFPGPRSGGGPGPRSSGGPGPRSGGGPRGKH